MGRNDSLKYETWTPDLQGLSASGGPLRLHSWFDYKRNVMVVEVIADPAPQAAAAAK